VNVQVNVAVETTLPRWVDGEHGTHQARARWQEFESAIQAHEDGHRAMAYQAGAALLKRLEELQAPYCVTLDQRAEEEATALLAVFRDRDRSYDRRTERGRLQGVVW
jgi:predicted secreted Zn-dependent protease